MNEIDKVKEAANPFAQLTKATNKVIEQNKEIISQNESQINLLGALCDSVDDNTGINRDILSGINTNHKELAAWKRKDTLMAWGVLSIACVALYLDYFRGWPVIKWLSGLIEQLSVRYFL